MKKTIFEYDGHPVTFENADTGQMINATEMAKPFGKRPIDFLRLPHTERFIEILKVRLSHNKNNEVIKTIRGRYNAGTWMHEKLALKFAAWLSPDFEIWVYDKIHELVTTGKTELDTRPGHGLIRSIRLIADQLEAHEKDIHHIKEDVSYLKEYVGDIEARLIVQDKNFLSVAAYCSLHNIDCPLDKAKQWGYKCTVLSKQLTKHFYHIHDPRFGRVGVYHTDVLKQIIQ